MLLPRERRALRSRTEGPRKGAGVVGSLGVVDFGVASVGAVGGAIGAPEGIDATTVLGEALSLSSRGPWARVGVDTANSANVV